MFSAPLCTVDPPSILEGAHTILSGDLALSGVIWRMSAHQRPRAPSGGRPSEGRYRRLAGAALRFS